MKSQKGFTLIELLIVIGIIAILAIATLVAVNPARLFGQSRNSVRESHLNAITSAVAQYRAEHEGNLPDTNPAEAGVQFPEELTCIGTDGTCINLAEAGEDGVSIVPDYIAEMPVDPQRTADAPGNTGYSIMINANGRIVASASGELDENISIIR